MKQVINKLSEKIRVNSATNKIVELAYDFLKQISDLYDIGEFYPVPQIDFTHADSPDRTDDVLYEKPTRAFSFYCDSVEWQPDERGFYVDMDKTGIGTSQHPWRNLTYALSKVYCFAKQCKNSRILQNTCFVLHCKGTYNYPVFCNEDGYGYRSYTCDYLTSDEPAICSRYTDDIVSSSYIPIYIVPWDTDHITFELDSTKVAISDELVSTGFSYADLLFGYDTHLVNCDITLVSSVSNNQVICGSMQQGSFSCNVHDNLLDFLIGGGDSYFKVPCVVKDMHFFYKNSFDSIPSYWERATWHWSVSYIDKCVFDSDFCRINIHIQPITNIDSVFTISYFTLPQTPPLHSFFIQNIKDVNKNIYIDIVAHDSDEPPIIPYLHLTSIDNLLELIANRFGTIFADNLTNIERCYLEINSGPKGYLINSSFANLDAGSFDTVRNISDIPSIYEDSFDRPEIGISGREVSDVHCKHSYMHIGADVCYNCSNVGAPYGASVHINKSATELSLHSPGWYEKEILTVSGSGRISNSVFTGSWETDGHSEGEVYFEDDLLIENCTINTYDIHSEDNTTIKSCDIKCSSASFSKVFVSNIEAISAVYVHYEMDSCNVAFECLEHDYVAIDGWFTTADACIYVTNTNIEMKRVTYVHLDGVTDAEYRLCRADSDKTVFTGTKVSADFQYKMVPDYSLSSLRSMGFLSVYFDVLSESGIEVGNVTTNLDSFLIPPVEGQVSPYGLLFCVYLGYEVIRDYSTMYELIDGVWTRVSCK